MIYSVNCFARQCCFIYFRHIVALVAAKNVMCFLISAHTAEWSSAFSCCFSPTNKGCVASVLKLFFLPSLKNKHLLTALTVACWGNYTVIIFCEHDRFTLCFLYLLLNYSSAISIAMGMFFCVIVKNKEECKDLLEAVGCSVYAVCFFNNEQLCCYYS